QLNTSHIRRHVSKSGSCSPASISRYSRTETPISHAAWQTRSPWRSRSRCIIAGNSARETMRRSLEPPADVGASCADGTSIRPCRSVTLQRMKQLGAFVAFLIIFGLLMALTGSHGSHEQTGDVLPSAYCQAVNAGQDPSVQPGIDCNGA